MPLFHPKKAFFQLACMPVPFLISDILSRASSRPVGAAPLTGYVSRLVDRCFVFADTCHQRLRCAALQLTGAAIQLTGSVPPPHPQLIGTAPIFHKPPLIWQAPPSSERCRLPTDVTVLQLIGAAISFEILSLSRWMPIPGRIPRRTGIGTMAPFPAMPT